MFPDMGHRIVCAANISKEGDIILGCRHCDKFMVQAAAIGGGLGFYTKQGFIDNKGNFLSRTEAWKVALEAGQITRRVGGDDAGVLYSENLY